MANSQRMIRTTQIGPHQFGLAPPSQQICHPKNELPWDADSAGGCGYQLDNEKLSTTMIGQIPPASDILHRSSRMHTHTQTHTLIQWNCLPFSLGRIQPTIKHEKWPHKCIKEFQAYGFCIQAAQLDVYNLHRFPSVRVARAPSSSSNRHII